MIDTDRPWVCHRELEFIDRADGILVLEDLSITGDDIVTGRSAPLPLLEWMRSFPLDVVAAGCAASRAGRMDVAARRRTMLEDFPWAAEYLTANPHRPVRPDGGGDVVAGADGAIEDRIIDAADESLEAARAAVDDAHDDGHFFVRYRPPGSWGSVLGDGAFCTEPKRGPPRDWCKRYSVQMTASFDCMRLTPEFAAAAATEWCRRVQHFYELWRSHGGEYVYVADDTGSYETSHEWLSVRAAVVPGGPQADKVALVDSLQPRNP